MSKQDTAQQLRKVANFLQGLVQAADDIEAIGSMEGATAEAKAALAVAERDRDSALAELADAKSKGKAAVASAQAKADKILADAEAQAQAYADKSRAEIDAYNKANTDAAVAFAASVVDTAKNKAAMFEGATYELTIKSQALTSEVSDLEAKRALAQAEFDKLTKALDKIKSQFRIGD